MGSSISKAFALAASMFVAASVCAQQTANIGFKSVGRAAPLAADLTNQEIVGAGFPIPLSQNGATKTAGRDTTAPRVERFPQWRSSSDRTPDVFGSSAADRAGPAGATGEPDVRSAIVATIARSP